MKQINSFPPPPSAPQPPLLYQYKHTAPPLSKWDGTSPTTPLFLEQIATYKAEDFYAGVHDWTCTTPAIWNLSVKIIYDMMALLPSLVPSMFLNDARFVSDVIAMLSSLLTHLNPYYREKNSCHFRPHSPRDATHQVEHKLYVEGPRDIPTHAGHQNGVHYTSFRHRQY